jgi:outer membrane protein assembly factor BamA
MRSQLKAILSNGLYELWLTCCAIVLLFLGAAVLPQGEATGQTAGACTQFEGRTIRRINFSGKFKLKRFILMREIDSRSGSPLDCRLLARDQKKIDGLGIFSEVRPEIAEYGDSVDIDFRLIEVWTLTPVLSAARTDNTFDFMIGAHERDVLGLYLNARGYYRRFEGENSYVFTGVFPRAFGMDFSMGVSLTLARQLDPLTVGGVSAEYRYLNKSIQLNLGWRVAEKLYQSIFFGYSRENWKLNTAALNPAGATPEVDYPQYLLGSSVNLGRVYSNHYYYDGVMLGSSITLVRELPRARFDRWRLAVIGYSFLVRYGFNFCFRGEYLTSSGDERVMPYSLSGEYNVRGIRDHIDRGDNFLGANFEVRRKVLELKHWYSQLAVFVDEGALWGRNRSASEGFRSAYWSIGFGARGALKRFPKIGRIDIALDTRTGRWSYYAAASQFF